VPGPGAYIGGFPCKAFSFLSEKTDLLRDPRAQPFYKVLHILRVTKPFVAELGQGVCSRARSEHGLSTYC
jgi:site-specific DNA-cytosine methylase